MDQRPAAAPPGDRAGAKAEIAAIVGVLVLGVSLRLVWLLFFPTQPFSDFANIVQFARAFARDLTAAGASQWGLFSPGAPFLLSFVLRTGVGSPESAARFATAVLIGSVPILPVVILRGVLPIGFRICGAVALAVWPGQIVFSGVVAQDNWAIAPTVALACVACKTILDRQARPVASGLLIGAAFLIRQEMLVAAAPLALAGAGVLPRISPFRRKAITLATTVALCLLCAAAQRFVGEGRFSIMSKHGGLAMLCSVVPGSSFMGYCAPPYSYVETFAPGQDASRAAWRLAAAELARRPVYHAVRATYFVAASLCRASSEAQFWSLSPNAMAPQHRPLALRVMNALRRPLLWEMRIIIFAFVAAFVLALQTRNWPVLVLASAVFLKLAFHGLTVVQPRYVMTVVPLMLLAVPLALSRLDAFGRFRTLIRAAVIALLCTLAVTALPGLAERWTRRHDTPISYRFVLPERSGLLDVSCTTRNAGIWSWSPTTQEKPLSFFNPNPESGDFAEAVCRMRDSGAARAILRLSVAPSLARSMGRFQVAVVNGGAVALQVDLGEAAAVRALRIPVVFNADSDVVIRLHARRLEPGWSWGHAARVGLSLRMARREASP